MNICFGETYSFLLRKAGLLGQRVGIYIERDRHKKLTFFKMIVPFNRLPIICESYDSIALAALSVLSLFLILAIFMKLEK